MAIKTLYFENVALFTKVWRKSETAPGAADQVTSLKTGKTAANNYFAFIPGVTDNAVYGASFIEGDADGAHGWRSELQYNGSFASGNWTIAYKLVNRAAYAHAGQLYARIYRTTVADPAVANLTKLNSVDGASATISFSATSGEVKTGTFTVNCDQNLTLTNEYLFIIINWKVTTAGGNANAGVKIEVNAGAAEKYDTIDWTPGVTQKTVTDSLSLADALPTGTPKAFLSLTDTLALADALPSGTPKAYIPVSDSLALADAISAIKVFFSLADTLSLTDAVSVYTGVVTKTVTDNLSLTDAAPTIKVFFTLTDVLSLADIAKGTRLLTVTDVLSLAEAVAFLGKVSLTDALSLVDQIPTIAVKLTVSDALSVAETLAVKARITIPDNLSLADVVALKVFISVGDSVVLAEAVSLKASLTINDSLALAEAISAKVKISVQDSLALAEAISVAIKQFISVSDTLTLADNMNEDGFVLIKITPAVYEELKRRKPAFNL